MENNDTKQTSDNKATQSQETQTPKESRFKSFTKKFRRKIGDGTANNDLREDTPPKEKTNNTIQAHSTRVARDSVQTPTQDTHSPQKSFAQRPAQKKFKSTQTANQTKDSHKPEQEKKFKGRQWSGKNPNAKNRTEDKDIVENGVRSVKNPNEKDNLSLHKDLRRGVEANTKIQRESLNAHTKLNLNTKASVRITPLGGLGEIGGNITVIETQNSAIIIDVGMSFPDESMHGVDILIPDFSYIHAIKDKIAGVIITHAHEDHIGAVPYLYKQLQFPLYGTPLPLGMIGSKFDEHGLKKYRSYFKIVQKRQPIKIGEFEIEWINITHSVIDASALAIKTEAGTIIHTGDFKIDHTPIDNMPTDLHRLAHYGEEGVMLLLSDSTNSHRSGTTPSEASVGPTFDTLFKQANGRVIMSTFSSNIHRVYQAINYGRLYNRKVAVIGRSMEKNLEIARELGYIEIPQNIFIEAHEVEKYPDNEILIVTTGSQGETMSALYRMATDEHRHIKIKPSDMVIISAKAIPGNEGSVSTVLNFLMKAGARVAYQDFSEIHVSGHAAQEEQKLMLRLIKPKFFLPVHGEYNHIAKHKETAIKCGVLEKNIFLMEDGDQIEVNPNYMRKVRSVKNGKIFIDNQINRQVDMDIVDDRQTLANDGIVIVSMQVSKERKILNSKISSYGLVANKEDKGFEKEMTEILELVVKNYKKEHFNAKTIEQEIQGAFRKHIFKKVKKYPTIEAMVYVL
ncbi:ribonuclease J [uncultured Helicobacter sp.]|uniref:ribonuclease J n=1 Tax=uncultured Helicobacter sp. TaxID=175537 RepID=UPI00374EDB2C